MTSACVLCKITFLFAFRCGTYQKTTGATFVFLSWLNFILFIRKVPFVGIYIVMFFYVVTTFFKFFIVFVFLIIMFAFSFYVLLHDRKQVRPNLNLSLMIYI